MLATASQRLSTPVDIKRQLAKHRQLALVSVDLVWSVVEPDCSDLDIRPQQLVDLDPG
jgi:hypothetical protein